MKPGLTLIIFALTASVAEAQRPPDPAITAAQLFAAYEANEIAADKRFKGKRITITGNVRDIGRDILGRPYLTLMVDEHGLGSVQAMFPRSAATALATIGRKQAVRVECEVDGKLMNVIVRDCKFAVRP
jgi:hypothetical protein